MGPYVCWKEVLSYIYLANIFCQHVACLFIGLTVSSEAQLKKIPNDIQLISFPLLIDHVFGLHHPLFPNPTS